MLKQSEERHEATAAGQDGGRVVPSSRESPPPAPSWEPKPIAVLAVEVTWPASNEGEVVQYEPWTVTSRWEQLIVDKVRGFGGILLPHSPSLTLVPFGIPRIMEQAPQRVVQAALAVRGLLVEAGEGGHPPELRLALHWGQVLVDTGESDPTARLLPMGDTLVRPGRLIGYAGPGDILASPEMGQLVGGWCDLRAREQPRGMGHADRIGVYTVVGLRPLGSPLAMHRQRPLSQFVGRERELAVLEHLLAQAREGRGQVAGIVGEPGVGKSRLCYEFMRMHPTQDWLILATSVDAYAQAIPYLSIIDLLKSYFQIISRDEVSAHRDKVTDQLRRLGRPVESSLPALLTLLDVPVEDAAWQGMALPQRRQRILDAIKRLLVRESRIQPILLVAENLHWIDGETQALLETLVEGLATTRILLLVTYHRPEYYHSWGSKTYCTQLRLDPLPREHARELLVSLLGDDANLAPLMQNLLQRSKGNPFFLEESVQTLVETLVLVGERGAYRLAKPLQNLQGPATVQAVLTARIDRLPPQEKRLLQTAAVIGMEVPCALLQAVAALPKAELYQGLAHLQDSEFLYEASLFPDRTFPFKHALTHELAYGSLLPERRRVLHARIVEASEQLHADHLSEQAERLAQHAFRGEVWDKAVVYCWQASTRAFARSAQREVVACPEQALTALKHLPESRATQEQAIDLWLDLRHALLVLGEFGQALDCLREAAALAEALDDQPRLGWVAAYMCRHCREMGDHDCAVNAGQHALAVAATLEDFALQVMARHFLGVAYHVLGDHRRAMGLLRSDVESLTGDLLRERFGGLPSVLSRAWLARCFAELGAFPEGTRHGEEAVRIAETFDHPNSPIIAYLGVGFLSLRQRDLAKAIYMLERGLDLCRVWNIQSWFPDTASALACAYAFSSP